MLKEILEGIDFDNFDYDKHAKVVSKLNISAKEAKALPVKFNYIL